MVYQDEFAVSFDQIKKFLRENFLFIFLGVIVGGAIASGFKYSQRKYNFHATVSGKDSKEFISSPSIKVKQSILSKMFSLPEYADFFTDVFFSSFSEATKGRIIKIFENSGIISQKDDSSSSNGKEEWYQNSLSFYLIVKMFESAEGGGSHKPLMINLDVNNRWNFHIFFRDKNKSDASKISLALAIAVSRTVDFYNKDQRDKIESQQRLRVDLALNKYKEMGVKQESLISSYQAKISELDLELNQLEIDVTKFLSSHNLYPSHVEFQTIQLNPQVKFGQAGQIIKLRLQRINWLLSQIPNNLASPEIAQEFRKKYLSMASEIEVLSIRNYAYIETPIKLGELVSSFVSDNAVVLNTKDFALPSIDQDYISSGRILVFEGDYSNRYVFHVAAGMVVGGILSFIVCLFVTLVKKGFF